MLFANQLAADTTPTIAPDASVEDLAKLLLETGLEGVCVVDDGRLVGVATAMDLVFQEKPVHLPTLHLFSKLVAPLKNRDLDEEILKATGTHVADIMTRDPVTVPFDASLEEVATQMVDGHFTVMPVVNGDTLLGVVTKRDVLRAMVARSQAAALGHGL